MHDQNDTDIRVEELSIPVPWGHVAAKAWGDPDDPHILAFHGLFDNAGSFDPLIPKLPKNFYYVCFDLPGHGRSSHFLTYLAVHAFDYILFYKLMVKYFKKDRYIFIGHSFGGLIGTFFARLYPEFVENIILLDIVHFRPVPANYFKTYLCQTFDGIERLNEKMVNSKPAVYTYDEALNRILTGRSYGELTEASAKILLKRGLVPGEGGKFYFVADQRLKYLVFPLYDLRYGVETFKRAPICCPVLIILSTASKSYRVKVKPVMELFEKSKLTCIVEVLGHHEVHMNNPESVAKYIRKFLLQGKSKL